MGEPIDETRERRMTRRLDGELSESEQEQLARELLRDPSGRRHMEALAAADGQGGEALRAAFGPTGPAALRNWPGASRRLGLGRRRWAVGVAAALLLAVGAGLVAYTLRPPGRGRPTRGGAERPDLARKDLGRAELPPAVEGLLWQVWDAPREAAGADVSVPLPRIQGPRRTRRMVDRHIFRVYDQADHTVYLLGVDRVRRTVHAVGGDL